MADEEIETTVEKTNDEYDSIEFIKDVILLNKYMDEEEAEEHILPALMLHVGEGVDRGHRPENADDAAEDEAHPVGATSTN